MNSTKLVLPLALVLVSALAVSPVASATQAGELTAACTSNLDELQECINAWYDYAQYLVDCINHGCPDVTQTIA